MAGEVESLCEQIATLTQRVSTLIELNESRAQAAAPLALDDPAPASTSSSDDFSLPAGGGTVIPHNLFGGKMQTVNFGRAVETDDGQS